MTPFSHREFTDSLITEKLRFCQVVDCGSHQKLELSPVAVYILRHHSTTKIQKITQSHTAQSIYKINKILSQVHRKLLENYDKCFVKNIQSSYDDNVTKIDYVIIP